MHYVPLFIKTNNSLLTSLIKIEELIMTAKKNNFKALTITDENMYGVMHFYKKCIENNIKPIIGLNIKIDNLGIILYAQNINGYKNLIKIQTINSANELNINILKKYTSDLICIVPYASLELYETLCKMYSKTFMGYQNKDERDKMEGDNLVFINETLCLEKDDQKYLNFLTAIKENKNIKDINNTYYNNYLYTYEEVSKMYPWDLENNKYICDACDVKLDFNMDLLPRYDSPDGLDSYTYLKKLCIDGLKKNFGEKIYKGYLDRLKYELDTINKMGFCNYFLVVWDFVKYAKEHDILVGPGRGSAAGSLVSYLLNITIVDPIKHNLFFERFLNPERVTMPDIDIDFEDTKRDEVINYCINKYGIKKVTPIITFSTMAAKQSIRDVGRAVGVGPSVVDGMCKYINSDLTLLDNYNQNEKFRDIVNMTSVNKKIFKVATKLEGIKRHSSIHAAGIIMSNIDLDEVIPLEKNDDMYLTGYDKDYLEEIGLLKMDFLSIKNLTLIKNCIDDINQNLSFYDIPINDEEAINIFTKADTEGIFQFEKNDMKNFLKKLKPSTFDDVVVALALFRPGPMNNIDSFIARKNGKEKVNYFHENLVNILKPTYGIIVYQEQIMQIASVLAGYSYGEADVLRRAMSKKKEEILLKEQDNFISRSVKKGYDEKLAHSVYDLILRFASYGFNKAHSVSYAYISVKMAYLKAHYPLYFYKQLLNGAIGNSEKTKEYLYECRQKKIELVAPNIDISSNEYIVKDNKLILPLTIIKNLGDYAAKTIVEERNKEGFKDIFDFVMRMNGNGLNKNILENLIYAGALDCFNLSRKTLKENMDIIMNYCDIGDFLDDSLKPELEYQTEYSKKEILKLEEIAYGFYMSSHPIIELRQYYPDVVSLGQIEQFFTKKIKVIVYVDRIRQIETKKGEKMAFLTASDELYKVDVVVFPKIYSACNDLKTGNIYFIEGDVEKRYDAYQINAYKIRKYEEL